MTETLPTIRVFVKETKSEVTINEADFNAELHEHLKPAKPSKTAKPSFRIEQKDDKFVILNSEGVQQGEEFDSEEAAKTMLAVYGA